MDAVGALEGCMDVVGPCEGIQDWEGLSEGSLVIVVFPSVIADTPFTVSRRQRMAMNLGLLNALWFPSVVAANDILDSGIAILFIFIVCAL